MVCTSNEGRCVPVTKGVGPVWPMGSTRLYFLRPVDPAKPEELWSVDVDGSDERFESPIGLFRPIDRFLTVSRDHVAAWSNFQAGQHEVWTAVVK